MPFLFSALAGVMVGIPIVRAAALIKLRLEVFELIGVGGLRLNQHEFSVRKINGVAQGMEE